MNLLGQVVATASDLILLKLYAGAPQDRWDIERLLATSNDPALREKINEDVADLPTECQTLWCAICEKR